MFMYLLIQVQPVTAPAVMKYCLLDGETAKNHISADLYAMLMSLQLALMLEMMILEVALDIRGRPVRIGKVMFHINLVMHL